MYGENLTYLDFTLILLIILRIYYTYFISLKSTENGETFQNKYDIKSIVKKSCEGCSKNAII